MDDSHNTTIYNKYPIIINFLFILITKSWSQQVCVCNNLIVNENYILNSIKEFNKKNLKNVLTDLYTVKMIISLF